MRHKILLAFVTILGSAINFLPMLTIAHAQASATNAFTPLTTIVPVDSTFINDFDCSFPLVEQVNGTIRDTLYFDQNGRVTREYISPQYQGTLTVAWTNPLTGTSLSSHEASSLIIYYNPDGSFQKLMNQGLTFMVIVPGAGQPLLADVGRIVIERGQGIAFAVGQHEELFGDTGAFCEYLSGAR
jgi:hypothetical protein